MSESDMRSRVIKMLTPLHAIAVENPVLPGTPDVNFVEGWLELKWIRNWPVGEDTPVKVDHYTPQQKVFMRKRHERGGNVGLLIQCKREWFFFRYPDALKVGELTKTELFEYCQNYTKEMTQERLIKWVTSR